MNINTSITIIFYTLRVPIASRCVIPTDELIMSLSESRVFTRPCVHNNNKHETIMY